MKIFRCRRCPGESFSERPGFLLYPDSAVIRDNKPFFVPSFSDSWCYRIGLAWKGCRLGKTIGAKFVDRYYDAVTVCLFPVPLDLPDGYGDVVNSFDGAAILGEWMLLPDAPVRCSVNGVDIDFGLDREALTDIIPWITRYCTLKIGDVVVSSVSGSIFEFPVDSHVKVSLNGSKVLNFNIK